MRKKAEIEVACGNCGESIVGAEDVFYGCRECKVALCDACTTEHIKSKHGVSLHVVEHEHLTCFECREPCKTMCEKCNSRVCEKCFDDHIDTHHDTQFITEMPNYLQYLAERV